MSVLNKMPKPAICLSIVVLLCVLNFVNARPQRRGPPGQSRRGSPPDLPAREANFTLDRDSNEGNYTINDNEENNFNSSEQRHHRRSHVGLEKDNSTSTEDDNDDNDKHSRPNRRPVNPERSSEESNESDDNHGSSEERPRFQRPFAKRRDRPASGTGTQSPPIGDVSQQ